MPFFLNSINDVQGTKHTKQFGSICGWPYCIVKCRQCFSDMVVDLTPHNFSAYFGILVSSPQVLVSCVGRLLWDIVVGKQDAVELQGLYVVNIKDYKRNYRLMELAGTIKKEIEGAGKTTSCVRARLQFYYQPVNNRRWIRCGFSFLLSCMLSFLFIFYIIISFFGGGLKHIYFDVHDFTT